MFEISSSTMIFTNSPYGFRSRQLLLDDSLLLKQIFFWSRPLHRLMPELSLQLIYTLVVGAVTSCADGNGMMFEVIEQRQCPPCWTY
ncbi:hypothetical protein EX30DRAFT_211491 [Ascodesmis nigricans]|uniref:Uncharacterized protein n=1 Tax=Ascodesmis nigricans TaxID=341454 RepID=A0A4S2MJX7_9PEZI|nr:hypothetical protein EX30DRAFT_211491 [Ascodesmis nigricans]